MYWILHTETDVIKLKLTLHEPRFILMGRKGEEDEVTGRAKEELAREA